LIQWFQDGNLLPKRIAWEIILGAYGHMKEEPSLVDVPIPAGQTVNVMYVSSPPHVCC
jgi:serine/threonine-protein phosphatase 5